MPDDDDQQWLDAVAGKPAAAAANLATVREGAVLRQAMMASQRPQARLDVEAGVRRLRDRLRQERLLQMPGLLRFGWKIPAFAAVVALVIAVGLASRERAPGAPPPPEVPVMKGEPGAVQEFITADALNVADEIHDQMKQAALNPRVTAQGSTTRLEGDWPRNPSEKQLEFLRFYGLARPSGPQLRIDVRPVPR